MRSAYGFDVAADHNWTDRAACRKVDPELFFNTDTQRLALHICRSHCPVIAECQQYTATYTPYDCVQAGTRWRTISNPSRRPQVWRQAQQSRGCPLCPQANPQAPTCGNAVTDPAHATVV